MKILSYNVYGVKDTVYPIPSWEVRQENLYKNINQILEDKDIKVLCFQEVNENNIELLEKITKENDFICLEKFPMKTETIKQYNIIAIKNTNDIKVNNVFCLPHGKDEVYKTIEEQNIDYNMSDYRTTVFVELEYENKKFLIGNIHTDYISTEGKIKGMVKSLNYMDKQNANYKFIETLKEIGLDNVVSLNIIEELSYYVEDMRCLKNICSEFKIHYEQILKKANRLDKNSVDCLFALMVYKNINHKDYEDMRKRRRRYK